MYMYLLLIVSTCTCKCTTAKDLTLWAYTVPTKDMHINVHTQCTRTCACMYIRMEIINDPVKCGSSSTVQYSWKRKQFPWLFLKLISTITLLQPFVMPIYCKCTFPQGHKITYCLCKLHQCMYSCKASFSGTFRLFNVACWKVGGPGI